MHAGAIKNWEFIREQIKVGLYSQGAHLQEIRREERRGKKWRIKKYLSEKLNAKVFDNDIRSEKSKKVQIAYELENNQWG